MLGLLAAAFVAGWIARAATGDEVPGEKSEGSETDRIEPAAAPALPDHLAVAVDQSRRELERATRAYHGAVMASLRDGEDHMTAAGPTGTALEALARALVALALAVDHESAVLEPDDPLARSLESNGFELRRLAEEVMLGTTETEVAGGVFDRLEERLTWAASAIFASSRIQTEPA